jgi:hypothetical protein
MPKKTITPAIEDVPISWEIAAKASRIISLEITITYELRVVEWDQKTATPVLALCPIIATTPVVLKDRNGDPPNPPNYQEVGALSNPSRYPILNTTHLAEMGIKLVNLP